jgi:uncharacterized Zn finger protein
VVTLCPSCEAIVELTVVVLTKYKNPLLVGGACRNCGTTMSATIGPKSDLRKRH